MRTSGVGNVPRLSSRRQSPVASRFPGVAQPLRATVYKIILTPAAICWAAAEGAPTSEREKLVLTQDGVGAQNAFENRLASRIHAALDIVSAYRKVAGCSVHIRCRTCRRFRHLFCPDDRRFGNPDLSRMPCHFASNSKALLKLNVAGGVGLSPTGIGTASRPRPVSGSEIWRNCWPRRCAAFRRGIWLADRAIREDQAITERS